MVALILLQDYDFKIEVNFHMYIPHVVSRSCEG